MPGRMQRTRWGRAGGLGGLLAAGLLLAGFLSGGSAGAAGPAAGDAAPDFSLTLFSAKAFNLSDLKGKPVFVNFFASW